jgi:hypothetical protein
MKRGKEARYKLCPVTLISIEFPDFLSISHPRAFLAYIMLPPVQIGDIVKWRAAPTSRINRTTRVNWNVFFGFMSLQTAEEM